ncbi:uncharacterized protein LOC122986283 [Thunnus albacares]|uniref:uncharacterized protein LOC122986283 n=1 Tax=Thunnus albacares TaxID=8236 RepID=UPI001CF6968C|nr:uncharacterized protein LOC122986283 [Thunnus albacares]
MEDHTYYLAQEKAREREFLSSSKKRKHEEAKRSRDRRRQRTRINIGVAFGKWKSLMRDKCFQSDAEVACFLLDIYERGPATSAPTKGKPFQVTAPAASSIGASNGTDSLHDMSNIEEDMEENVFNDPLNSVIDWADEGSPYYHEKDDGETDDSSDEEYLAPIRIRMGGALKKEPSINQFQVIGMDGIVHDHPAHEDPPDEPPSCDQAPVFPNQQHVLCEDDIIGAKASILYEDCLRQLATFLILPVDKCTGLLKTGVMCDCVAPFEINITSKGTATSVEWVCPNGHSLWRWNSQPVMKFGMQAGDFLLSTNILLSGNNYAKVALLFKYMNMGMVNKNTFFSIQDTYCVDTGKDFWEERKTEALSHLQGRDVVVLEIPQQHVCKEEEEEVPADQQLCNQERNSSLDPEDPEPPQIKEEQEELCITLKGEHTETGD